MTAGRTGASSHRMRSLNLLAGAALALGLALIGAAPAGAQDNAPEARSPAERQSLIDLAYVLGRSHALRQVCDGRANQYWRTRMQALIAAEAPDPAFDRQLEQSFNAGFAAAQAAFPRCTADARREQTRAAERGHDLAQDLSQPAPEDEPPQ